MSDLPGLSSKRSIAISSFFPAKQRRRLSLSAAAANTSELIAYAKICAAIVDVSLGGHDCSSVCAALTKRSIPFFMFYTG
jgi:hypothetical protein